jgi:hypothetical protein
MDTISNEIKADNSNWLPSPFGRLVKEARFIPDTESRWREECQRHLSTIIPTDNAPEPGLAGLWRVKTQHNQLMASLEILPEPGLTRHEALDLGDVSVVAAAPPASREPLIDAAPQHIVRTATRIIRASGA